MKTILILVLIYIAYLVIKGYFFKKAVQKNAAAKKPGPARRDGEEDVTLDPVCGSYVPLSSAVSIDEGGKKVYFCGPECRDRFSRDA